MKPKSVKAKLKSLFSIESLTPSAKERLAKKLEHEIEQFAKEKSMKPRITVRPRWSLTLPILAPLAVIFAIYGVYTHPRTVAPVVSVAGNSVNPAKSVRTDLVKLSVDTSEQTVNAGPLSNVIPSNQRFTLKLPGTSNTRAQVLASIDGDGTVVAVNGQGDDSISNKGWSLYFLSTKTNSLKELGHGNNIEATVITSAAMSNRWMVWAVFYVNGVMANIGVLDRDSGKLRYVEKGDRQMSFLRMALSTQLFLKGDDVYVLGMNGVYKYDLNNRRWSTFYTPPANSTSQVLDLQLTRTGVVLELTGNSGRSPSRLVQLNYTGSQIGPVYELPKNVMYETGADGNTVFFNGTNNASYSWTVGSHTIDRVADISSSLSGAGSQFFVGVTSRQGQLLDMRTKQRFNFDADSALITKTRLYWTLGNVLYGSVLPK